VVSHTPAASTPQEDSKHLTQLATGSTAYGTAPQSALHNPVQMQQKGGPSTRISPGSSPPGPSCLNTSAAPSSRWLMAVADAAMGADLPQSPRWDRRPLLLTCWAARPHHAGVSSHPQLALLVGALGAWRGRRGRGAGGGQGGPARDGGRPPALAPQRLPQMSHMPTVGFITILQRVTGR